MIEIEKWDLADGLWRFDFNENNPSKIWIDHLIL